MSERASDDTGPSDTEAPAAAPGPAPAPARLQDLLSERWLRFARVVLLLPVGLFLAGTVVAVFSSPALRPTPSPGTTATGLADTTLPPFTLPPPAVEVRIGSWEGEPRCREDRRGDVALMPESRPRAADPAEPRAVGGPGDLTSVCVDYGARIAVEARMDEPVDQEPDDRDDAIFEVVVEATGDDLDDFGITVERRGPDIVATVLGDYSGLRSPLCAASAAWRDRAVRVEVDPLCLGDPAQLSLRVGLRHYDTDDFVSLSDALPQEPQGPQDEGSSVPDDDFPVTRRGS